MAQSITEQGMPRQEEVLGRLGTYFGTKLRQAYKAKLAYAFLAPAFLLIITFIAYPLVRSLILSLYEWNGITQPKFIGLTNFKFLFQEMLTDVREPQTVGEEIEELAERHRQG